MPLTPQDVRNKLFTSVRLQRGYDEDEVDAFLDEVEVELARLYAEIDGLKSGRVAVPDFPPAAAPDDSGLRAALEDAGTRHAQELESIRAEQASVVAAARTETESRLQQQIIVVTEQAEAIRRQAEARLAQAAQQAQQQHQQLQQLHARAQQAQAAAEQAQRQAAEAAQELARLRASSPDGSHPTASTGPTGPVVEPVAAVLPPPSPTEDALRRTLLLAQRTADEAVAEARAEAQRIVTDAQRHATESARRAEAEHLAAMTQAKAEYEVLAGKLEELRGFERDYRSRLRAYLHMQLRDLEAGAPEPTPAVVAAQRGALTERMSAMSNADHDADDAPSAQPSLHDEQPTGGDAR